MARRAAFAFAGVLAAALAVPAWGGGAWLPVPGQGDFQLGFSRKTAHTSWDSRGSSFDNTTRFRGAVVDHHHDFRYDYLSGEVGVVDRLSFRFLLTYLHGLEGPRQDLEKNVGPSDAWLGVKYRLRGGDLPMALAFTVRTSYLYDLEGAYDRHLFDEEGNVRGVSPEWRGLLKEDYTLSYLISHSYAGGRGWMNLEAGYSYRAGAPADELPVFAEFAYPLPFLSSAVKATAAYVQAMGNDSPRQPDDRFGSRPGFNFNNASMGRAGVAWIAPVGTERRWAVEVGYNQWLWGRSARRYREPYLSFGYRF